MMTKDFLELFAAAAAAADVLLFVYLCLSSKVSIRKENMTLLMCIQSFHAKG